jgi:VIT1/CCC1 family predicted Fe2+/Mn2+ transporter
MPPDLRNHLDPTGIDTPTSAAASSLDRPAAIAAQNPTRSSRIATGGRPGDFSQPSQPPSPGCCDDRLRPPLGISETVTSHPIQAAVVSALTFSAGAVVPLLVAVLAPPTQVSLVVAATTLFALAVLGGLGASAGGAGIARGAVRVTFWRALAMAATAAVGMIFGLSA